MEIVRPGEEATTATIISLMKKVTDDLVSLAGTLMAHLCNVNLQPFGGAPHPRRRIATRTATQQESALFTTAATMVTNSSGWDKSPDRKSLPHAASERRSSPLSILAAAAHDLRTAKRHAAARMSTETAPATKKATVPRADTARPMKENSSSLEASGTDSS